MASRRTNEATARKPGSKTRSKSKRGAPKGNQNARTHGFFSAVLTDDELAEIAVTEPDLDDLCRLIAARIRRAMDDDKVSLDSLARAADTFIRAKKAQHLLSGQAARNLETAIANALDEIASELNLPV